MSIYIGHIDTPLVIVAGMSWTINRKICSNLVLYHRRKIKIRQESIAENRFAFQEFACMVAMLNRSRGLCPETKKRKREERHHV